MPFAFNCDFPSALTSFNLSINIAAHGSPGSSGPAQQVQQTGCRPGLWRVTYTNGYPAGFGGPYGSLSTDLQAQGIQYGINPGTGVREWHTVAGLPFASFHSDGTMDILRDPATFISGTTWESFYCAGSEITFTLNAPFTTFYDGLTIQAVGAWQAPCQIEPGLLSS